MARHIRPRCGCIYCCGEESIRLSDHDGELIIKGNKLHLQFNTACMPRRDGKIIGERVIFEPVSDVTKTTIDYCPICGRKL